MTASIASALSGTGTRRRRRILFSTNRFRTYDQRLYETLADAFDLRVLWISPPPKDEPVPDWGDRIRCTVVGDRSSRLTALDVRRSAALYRLAVQEARGCDLVVASTSTSWKARVLYAAARRAGVPIAVRTDIWCDDPNGTKRGLNARVQRRITDALERRVDGVLVCGVKAEAYTLARGVAGERIAPFRYLHPDFARAPLDAAAVDRLRALKGDRVAFLYLGRIIDRKGLVPLIRAFRAVLATGRDAMLFVVGAPITEDTGRGEVTVDYYDHARRLAGDDPRIVFFGQVAPAEVLNYYAAADVFVHPHVAEVGGFPVYEGWGNVMTEAACMSKPIIATDRIPSAFDLIADGANGYLLAADHLEDELQRSLVPFIDHPELVTRFGRESRRRYEAFADPALNVAALDRIIDAAGAVS